MLGLAQLYQIRGRVGRGDERRPRVPDLPGRQRALRGGARAASRRSPTTPSSARATGSRCATSSCAAPATCSATSSRATWPRSASSSTASCSPRPSPSCQGAPPRTTRPVRVEARSTPTCPPTTCRSRRPRSTCTAAIALAETVDELRDIEIELADRFGPPPEPVENLLAPPGAAPGGRGDGHHHRVAARRHVHRRARRARLTRDAHAARALPRGALHGRLAGAQPAPAGASPRRPARVCGRGWNCSMLYSKSAARSRRNSFMGRISRSSH